MAANAWGYCDVCGRCVSLYVRSDRSEPHGLYKPMVHKRERTVGKGPTRRKILERCPGSDVPIHTQMTEHKIARGEALEDWRKP
jgi:hypothetical protein